MLYSAKFIALSQYTFQVLLVSLLMTVCNTKSQRGILHNFIPNITHHFRSCIVECISSIPPCWFVW